MDQHRGQAGVCALAGLHQADNAEALRLQAGSEIAQDCVGVLIRSIGERGEIALGVKHGLLPSRRGDRGSAAIPLYHQAGASLYLSVYHSSGWEAIAAISVS
jgi:hypothetical protein